MDACACFMLILCIIISLAMILLLISMDSLEPLHYGITYNKITKTIGTEIYDSGRYIIGPTKGFIIYPAHLVTIEFSDSRKAMVFSFNSRALLYKQEQQKVWLYLYMFPFSIN